jgi:hypothetical protein
MYFLLVFSDSVEDFLHPLRNLPPIFPVRSSAISSTSRPIRIRKLHPSARAAAALASSFFYALKFPYVHLAFLTHSGFVWFRWIRLPASFALVLWISFQCITWEQKIGISLVSSLVQWGERPLDSLHGLFGDKNLL